MKRIPYIVLLSVLMVVLITCRKRPELRIYKLELAEETVVTSTNGATITTSYSYPGYIPTIALFVSTNSAMGDAVEFTSTATENTITATATDLAPNTKYYYYFRYSNGINLINTDTKNFITEGFTLPEVTTGEISEIASNSAHCSGEATSTGNSILSAIGFCYGTRHNPNLQDNVINCGDSLGVFEADITNLDINTLYYVRTFATNEGGTAYGEQKTFTTLGQVPTVVTIPITFVTSSSAVSGGSISNNGGNAVIEKGVCWSTVEHPTIADSHTSDGSGNGAYISNLTDLLPNTLYYVRAYATNSEGTGYGNELTFTTSASLAVLTTKTVSNITQTSASCGGNITNSGGMDITARGICWSTSHNPTTNDHYSEDGTGIGEFNSELTDLSANVKYYVRAYATSDYGTSYGNEVEFTTSMGMPTVSTKSVTGITASSASCGGEVTNSGGGTISARGVCWGTSHEPTISDSHTTDGTGVGEFISSITELNNNVTYYVRAYATNSNGTAYGEERSFTTQEGLAVVTTTDITNITATSASSGGEITDDGGYTITARGVCWSTSQNPTTSDSHTSDGTGTGSYASSLTSLAYNTTYYIRAYATNSKGTSYGEEKTFTTNKLTPTVTTAEATSVTSNSAVTGGNVTSDGGASVTARGVCWSTSQNPTISGNHTTDGNGTGEFTSNLTGLEENTTYYIRAYATNSEGTSYGSQKTFMTSQNVVVPTVTTSEVTNISTTSASCGGNVTSAGNGTISARGVCWSTSQNPTISNSHSTDGTGTGAFTSSITGLTENTTYYVRAYATNEAGTNYGEQTTFTTPHATTLPTVTTNNITEITQETAVSGGNVTSAGYGTVSAKGVCWSTSQNPTITDPHTTDGTGTGSFISNISGLSSNTTYYVRAYATNEAGTNYGEQKLFTTETDTPTPPTWTNGILPGLFSISSTQQVHFSQGNLQYQASTNTWRFAENQWNFIGGSMGFVGGYYYGNVYENGILCNNSELSSSYGGWIDLFGWGTSGYNHNGHCYQPWSHTTSSSDYYAYYGDYYNLYDQTAMADWGYNAISNGGNQENQWRTMKNEEWDYVINNRETTSNIRYAKAQVNGVNGIVLLPDEWNSSTYNFNNPNTSTSSYNSNVIDLNTWIDLEIIGAVFLPAAGYRTETAVYDGIHGYWTSTHYDQSCAYYLNFDGNNIGVYYNGYRYHGHSVRLVYSTTTPSLSLPTVTANQPTSMTSSMVVCGGIVTSDGGSPVTSRGVCWSTSQNPTVSDLHTIDGSGTGEFTSVITGFMINTPYHVRAYATNELGTAYSNGFSFTYTAPQTPTGAIKGVFSVSDTQHVWFSQGNLQYQASSDTWRFATNQYDCIGDDNAYISSSYNGWIDLLGWGTSGINHGAVCYQPWSTSNNDNDYFAYGNAASNLNEQSGKADWGYNIITNGGGAINAWRTLTNDELLYIFNTRNTLSGIRYAKAIVNSVNGVVVLPDNWNSSIYFLANTNQGNASFDSNSISLSEWTNVLEFYGAVFLPASGIRNGTTIQYVGLIGSYWSAICGTYGYPYSLRFVESSLTAAGDYYGRHYGCSVRLVRDVE